MLRFVFSHDDVAVDISKKTISINGTEFSLNNNHKFIKKNLCNNRIDLIVTVYDETLSLELPSHGLLLETKSFETLFFKVNFVSRQDEDSILIFHKIKEKLYILIFAG